MKNEEKTCICKCCKKMGVAFIIALLAIIGLIISNVIFINKSNGVTTQPSLNETEAYAGALEYITQYMLETEMSDIIVDKLTAKEVTGHGISEEDGAVYITFKYAISTQDENGNSTTGDWKNAKMFFWKDKETGKYSIAFNWLKDEQ